MKNSLATLTLITITWVGLTFGQSGVYRTYKDFKNGNLEDVGLYRKTYHVMGNFKVIFRKGNEKIKIKAEEIWGYRNDEGHLIRIANKRTPAKVVIEGVINYYVLYDFYKDTIIDKESGDITIRYTRYSTTLPPRAYYYYFSYGYEGEMIWSRKKEYKKAAEKDAMLNRLFNNHNEWFVAGRPGGGYADLVRKYNELKGQEK